MRSTFGILCPSLPFLLSITGATEPNVWRYSVRTRCQRGFKFPMKMGHQHFDLHIPSTLGGYVPVFTSRNSQNYEGVKQKATWYRVKWYILLPAKHTFGLGINWGWKSFREGREWSCPPCDHGLPMRSGALPYWGQTIRKRMGDKNKNQVHVVEKSVSSLSISCHTYLLSSAQQVLMYTLWWTDFSASKHDCFHWPPWSVVLQLSRQLNFE